MCNARSVICNESNMSFVETKFGQAPLESVLSNQCGLLKYFHSKKVGFLLL